ncbi:hypothetical protein KKF60_02890 [Patescibacteria group bacterium]|nr:hypothetical protein [Patescibacteria group bacterium]MBU4458816.1 hypothetical protein [Patescibacteria group bacterium]MCG2696217.1 hypothetical protein [Candidatus Portnoybacteria bacterium]
MIKNKCEHEWEKHTDASQQFEVGAIPAYFMCTKCKTLMTAPEVFQLEALENQNETLKYLKGFQKYLSIVMSIIAVLSLIIAILK